MGDINLKNILFIVDKNLFLEIERKATTDLIEITKQQKVKDDIFNIIKRLKNVHLVMFPIKDDELCAFTLIKKDKGFIYINTYQSMNLQIFAAAHELYHFKYDSENISELLKNVENEFNGTLNEMIANSYAACFLVPKHLLSEQIQLLNIDTKNITLESVLMLMEAFAVPFKAMVLRLFEAEIITDTEAEKFLENQSENIIFLAKQKRIGVKWLEKSNQQEYSNLLDLALRNFNEASMSTFKIIRDFESIQLEKDIKELLSKLNDGDKNDVNNDA